MPNNCYKPIWHTFVGLLFLFLVRFNINSVFTTWWRCSCTSCCIAQSSRLVGIFMKLVLYSWHITFSCLETRFFQWFSSSSLLLFLFFSLSISFLQFQLHNTSTHLSWKWKWLLDTMFNPLKHYVIYFCFIVSRRYAFRVSTGS